MNELEAKRIAAVTAILRPEWREGLVMAVLGDDRIRHMVYEDVLVAAVACYSDMTTKKPGRIHEPGRWWLTVTAQAPAVSYRTITANDCGICSRPASMHSPLSKVDPHPWEPQRPSVGVGPTPEQRAAIEAAREAAHVAATAAREQPEKREPRDPNEVIAEHVNQKEIA